MAKPTQRDMIIEMRTALVGMNGDEGLVGDTKEIKEDMKILRSQVQKNDHAIGCLKGQAKSFVTWKKLAIIIGSGGGGAGAWATIQKLSGG